MQYTMDSHNNSSLSPRAPQDDANPNNMLAMANQEAKTADISALPGNTGSAISAQYLHELTLARTIGAGNATAASKMQGSKNNPKKRSPSPAVYGNSAQAASAAAAAATGIGTPKRSRLGNATGPTDPLAMLQAPRANLDVRLSPHPTRNMALQQQFSLQQQRPASPNQGSLPRPPTSPGSWNVGSAMMGPDDFVGANAALRRNLVTLQQQQQHQHQHQHQQQQQNPFQVPQQAQGPTSGFATNPQATGGMGMGTGMGMGMGMSSSQMQMGLLDDPRNAPNQMWATEMLLRTGGPQGSNNPNNNDSLMQLQLLRQQQARIQQLEQLEEEAAMRRQLQLLRQNNNNNNNTNNNPNPGTMNMNMNMNVNMNPVMDMNMNMGMNANMNPAMNMQDPSSIHPLGALSSSATASANNNNNNNDAISIRESILLQQQLQQQQQQQQHMQLQHASQGMFLPQHQQQQQQQSQWGMSSPHQATRQLAQPPFAGATGIQSGARNIALPDTSLQRTSRAPQSLKVPSFRRAPSAAIPSSSMARATPMEGPIAPPVPAPPPISEANYRLPPIEEGETRHYDQRLHVPLAIEEDPNWLSEFQCFVRKELLQVFRASHQDVKIRVASKKVYYKQVGIRCRFCAHWKPSTRAIRSSAFPFSIRQLYQSFTMMLRDHFGNCPAIPAPLKDRFLELKRNNTQGASDSMRYWIYSAVKLGMVDSECGIVLNEQTQAAASNKPPFGTTTSGPDTSTNHPPRLLVKPEDLEQGTIESEFLYTLLTQYQLIRLQPTECIGNRKSLRPGVPGLGCRYCCHAGRMGLSRVFPAKKKQLPTQIQDLYDHIRRCNLCPLAIKEELKEMKVAREKDRLGSGSANTNPSSAGASSSSATGTSSGKSSKGGKGDDKDKDRPMRIIDDEDKGFVDLLWQRLGHRGELATPMMM